MTSQTERKAIPPETNDADSPAAHLDTAQAAEYLKIPKSTLEVWRSRKTHGIPYYKIGSRVRYARADLDAWLQSRRIGGAA